MITNLKELLDLSLSSCSHRKIQVECEFKVSKNCRNVYFGNYRDLIITAKNHQDKICCLNCSRILKVSHKSKGLGRINPNCKYKFLEDDYLSEIDTKEKAYVLGWIASDGNLSKNGVTISIKDKSTLEDIRDIICPELKIKSYKDNIWTLAISSRQMAIDCIKHLGLKSFGKKDKDIKFPEQIKPELKWHFLRGYFDGDGSINLPHGSTLPKCKITSNSSSIRKSILDFCEIPCSNSEHTNEIYWSGNNAMDFLFKLYSDSTSQTRLHRKYVRYLDWSNWVPSLSGSGSYESALSIRFNKASIDAVLPSKTRATDVGFDLTLISIWKKIGNITFYETNIKALPDHGWYLMMAPRSSIVKSGYMLANSVGIIDRSYVGTIKVPLIKVDENVPDLELPCKMVQLIPCLGVNAQIIEVAEGELEETVRGEKGFGSSGR